MEIIKFNEKIQLAFMLMRLYAYINDLLVMNRYMLLSQIY